MTERCKMEKLYRQIKEYVPYNRQEAADKRLMLQFMERNPDALSRENLAGHFATSAWVVNPQRTKVLMIYHNIYKSWSWAGGHADGEQDLLAVVRREIAEETGYCHGNYLNAQFKKHLGITPGQYRKKNKELI